MLSALILVCSLAAAPDLEHCTEASADIVLRDPEAFASPLTCFLHGQAYLAETAIGAEIGESPHLVRVVCARRRLDARSR